MKVNGRERFMTQTAREKHTGKEKQKEKSLIVFLIIMVSKMTTNIKIINKNIKLTKSQAGVLSSINDLGSLQVYYDKTGTETIVHSAKWMCCGENCNRASVQSLIKKGVIEII